MKTRIDPKTKQRTYSIEGYERKRIVEACEVLELLAAENIPKAGDIRASLIAFLVSVDPPKTAVAAK